MTFEKDLQTRKNDALKLYQLAKAQYLQDKTAENWRNFCDRKADCMRLGVRIQQERKAFHPVSMPGLLSPIVADKKQKGGVYYVS